jgi:hypothetical protein
MLDRVHEIQLDLLASRPTSRGTDDGIQSSDKTGFSGARTIDRLSEQVKFGHEAWMERLREMQNIEAEYTKELVAARDPNEVLKICNR